MRRYHPICLAPMYLYEDQFPMPAGDRYALGVPRFTRHWLTDKLRRYALGSEPYAQRIVEQRGAKLIHAHFGPNGAKALGIARPRRLAVITSFYGMDVGAATLLKRNARAYRRLFDQGDMMLVEGLHMKARLVELGCPPERIELQRIGVPLEMLPFRARAPKDDRPVVVLFAGRFVEKKGIRTLLDAARQVRQTHDNFQLRLIGHGPMDDQVTQLVGRHDMSDYVKLPGFLNYDQYLAQMQEADLFVHPSMTAPDGDTEGGAPTTILEAQAMGLPVIATTHADIPNVVVPGVSALLSGENDPAGLAEHLLCLIDDQDRWAAMGRAGREFVSEHHDIDKLVNALEEKYDRVLAPRAH